MLGTAPLMYMTSVPVYPRTRLPAGILNWLKGRVCVFFRRNTVLLAKIISILRTGTFSVRSCATQPLGTL